MRLGIAPAAGAPPVAAGGQLPLQRWFQEFRMGVEEVWIIAGHVDGYIVGEEVVLPAGAHKMLAMHWFM